MCQKVFRYITQVIFILNTYKNNCIQITVFMVSQRKKDLYDLTANNRKTYDEEYEK